MQPEICDLDYDRNKTNNTTSSSSINKHRLFTSNILFESRLPESSSFKCDESIMKKIHNNERN